MQQGMPASEVQEYHAKWEENYKEDAKKGVKTSFLVEALAREEKLHPTPEDITNYFADLSDKTNIAIDKIKSYYSGAEKQNELEFKLMEEKVLQFIKDNATIEK
jgi:FKBP-type peptidyl-prolyl cis-trans isomerase (trigger factor)